MALEKITDVASSTLKEGASILVTQTENGTSGLRRVPFTGTMDKTLSSTALSAESRATGEAIKGAMDRADYNLINYDDGYLTESVTFEQGNIIDGQDSTSNKNYRLRTPVYYATADYDSISINRNAKPWATFVSYYNYSEETEEYAFVESSGRVNSATIAIDAAKGTHIRIMCADLTNNSWVNRIYPFDGMSDYSLRKISKSVAFKSLRAIAYLSGGAEFYYKKSGNNYILNLSGANLLIRLNATGNATVFQFADFVAAAVEAGWSEYSVDDVVLGVVCPRPACSVYYNINTGGFVFSSKQYEHSLLPEMVCLFEGHYTSVAGGLLVDYYNYMQVKSIEQTIDEHIGKNTSMPDYYVDHMSTKSADILANMSAAGRHGETFIFITDLHWEQSQNARNSPALIKYLLARFNINTIICGGDLINQGLRQSMIDVISSAVDAFDFGIPFPIAFGNHDDNWNDWNHQREYPDRKFDNDTVYALLQKQTENDVTYISDNDFDFYYDRPGTKTRFIILDTHNDFTFTNYSTLADCLLATPAGWHVIIVGHAFYASSTKKAYATNIENMADAFNARESVTISNVNYDFTNAAAKVHLIIGGHVHRDMDWTTTAGIPVILSDCDAFARSQSETHTKGTVTEQCFDVVTVDYANDTVKCVRIGRGENRYFPPDEE